MKPIAMILIALPVFMAPSAYADPATANPYVLPAPPPPPVLPAVPQPMMPPGGALPVVQPMTQAEPEALPPQATENRSVLESMMVVGRKGNIIRLRWSQTSSGGAGGPSAGSSQSAAGGSSSSGTATRSWQGKSGDILIVGGRPLRVVASRASETVALVMPDNEKQVVWMAGMDNPTSYQVDPVLSDYQYTPPLSAGVGIRRNTVGSNGSNGVSQ